MGDHPVTQTTARPVNAPQRPLHAIARDIRAAWGDKLDTTGYAAKPYVEALEELESIADSYGQDSAQDIALRFLSNASQFKGEQARALKEELRGHLPRRR